MAISQSGKPFADHKIFFTLISMLRTVLETWGEGGEIGVQIILVIESKISGEQVRRKVVYLWIKNCNKQGKEEGNVELGCRKKYEV